MLRTPICHPQELPHSIQRLQLNWGISFSAAWFLPTCCWSCPVASGHATPLPAGSVHLPCSYLSTEFTHPSQYYLLSSVDAILAASAVFDSYLEMHILRLHPRPNSAGLSILLKSSCLRPIDLVSSWLAYSFSTNERLPISFPNIPTFFNPTPAQNSALPGSNCCMELFVGPQPTVVESLL